MIEVAITGVCGRMGQRLVALARQDRELEVVAAIERPNHEMLGFDAGEVAGVGRIGVAITADLRTTPKVLIDFAHPTSTRQWLKTCRESNVAMVIGTTGLQLEDHAAIDEAANRIPILQAPNMSLGMAILCKVAAEVAKTLGDDCDIEILEAHHRFKKDAPSGTAFGLADAILNATGKTRDALVFDLHGDDCPRRPGQIGVHAMRLGDEIGRHTAYFGALGERLELTHRATNRDTFVFGALRAAKWLAQQQPGRYRMADVLGIQ